MNKIVFVLIFLLVLGSVSAEELVLQMSKSEFTAGESGRAYGYVFDDTFNAKNSTNVTVALDGTVQSVETTDTEGYYSYTLTNLTAGEHNVSVNTTLSSNMLTFTVLASEEVTTYTIIASSLVAPYRNPTLNFTVKKYVGSALTNHSYNYTVYYPNGSSYATFSGLSNTLEVVTLPSQVGMYRVIVDGKKSFTVSVAQFTLKYSITDKAGNLKTVFSPNKIAYFKVEGFTNGNLITNATVTADVTDPTGLTKTVTFTETNGVYTGNTNVTQTTSIQLRSGEYEVEFSMKDSSNNEQKANGFFSVVGLSVEVDLLDKKPYMAGETAEFDVVVKNLENGNLIEHNNTAYSIELEKDGIFYDVSSLSSAQSSDATKTSRLTFVIPAGLEDGDYFLKVGASSSGKAGKGAEYFQVMNTEMYVVLTDSYGDRRDIFKPSEGAKIALESNTNLSFVVVQVEDISGVLQSTVNASLNGTSGAASFNVPSTQGDYLATITVTTSGSDTVERKRWFSVQNYFSFLDIKDMNNNMKFSLESGETFRGEINVFDIATGQGVDISNFVTKFDKIVNEETAVEYTNFQYTKNTTLSDDSAGRSVYSVTLPALNNGIYRLEYTLVNSKGKSFKGRGWFGISAFGVTVTTSGSDGQQKSVFASGASVNITLALSQSLNGTATIHREFFDPVSFTVLNGYGSTVLTSASSQLPSQSGFYGFGVEVVSDEGETGLGDGFFEVRNLNFRSITVRNNGDFGSGDNILADVVVEKSGSLVNSTNVTLARLFRAWDGLEVGATAATNPALTNNLGSTAITITPTTALEAGNYFAEIKATQGDSVVYGGFGFQVVEDKVIITINDDDNIFTTTENVEINVKVTYQNDTPRNNVTINLTGLLNLGTWAQVSTTKQGTTSSNGVATITLSAANYNPARYAPVVSVKGMDTTFVGFGTSEFEIIAFSSTVAFQGSQESYSINENVLIDVTVVGDATVTAAVTDTTGAVQDVDYYYANGVLTMNNDLSPGEYFVAVSVLQGTNTVTETLWFEVLAPWMHVDPLPNPTYGVNDTLNFSYTVFTMGANGWNPSSGTVELVQFENMWTGNTTTINTTTNAVGTGSIALDLGSYSLSKGDYLLHLQITENPDYDDVVYFRVDNNVRFEVTPVTTEGSNDVTIIVNTTGLSSSTEVYLDGYNNFESYSYTTDGSLMGTGENMQFAITDLPNGFYKADVRLVDGSDVYYANAYFDIRVRSVTISAAAEAIVGSVVSFNISSGISSTLWIIDPFSQNVLKTVSVTPGNSTTNYTFTYSGSFIYGYGDDKFEVFKNSHGIQVIQKEFSVEWPFESNMYQLTGAKNFTFNVTSDAADTALTLRMKNHFSGNTVTRTDLTTHAVSGTKKQFTFDLDDDLGLQLGPHDVELVLEDGSTLPPKQFFFIDIFPDQYNMLAWTNQGEYRAGDTVRINIDVNDVMNNGQNEIPDDVTLDSIKDPSWNDFGASLSWTGGNSFATFLTDATWVTGNYHVEINVTEGSTTRTLPLDFFVRGNDNLQLLWNQEKWDYATTDVFQLTVDARDNSAAAAGVPAVLMAFEKSPEQWDQDPENYLGNVTGFYNFTNDNVTDAAGRIVFSIDIGGSGLQTGSYTGRLNVGGQIVWFDFSVRSYQVDAYPEQGEYGIADTIQVNVRARNIETWLPISADGNVTIVRIERHEPGVWQPQTMNLADFGITNAEFDVVSGEALIEMLVNNTALNLTKPYEFEMKLQMDLETYGSSEGWAWFRVSNTERPGVTIVDRTGQTPDTFFGGQSYTLQVTNVLGATLRDIWGPCGRSFNDVLVDNDGTFTVNFTTPTCPGYYTVEVDTVRAEGYTEPIYTDFQIGSGTEMNVWTEGNVVPEVNFTVYVNLFGEGTDPWCSADPYCTQSFDWFGPLANKTITLKTLKDLNTFTSTDLTGLGIAQLTNDFPSWMFPDWDAMAACNLYNDDEDGCNSQSESCMWMSEGSRCELAMGGPEPEGDMMEMGNQPGLATFNLHPTVLNLTAGKKYNLIFSYTDDDGEETEEKVFLQVEKFHVAISKRERNIAAGSTQYVWLKATDLYGVPLENCTIVFDSIYNEKDYQLVKTISVSENTSSNGSVVFTYAAPTLPGKYLVEGTATCNISAETVSQEAAYFIEVGAKNLEVDMKTKFEEDENLKISITTKDRLGQPVSQRVEVSLFHDREDYPNPIYSVGGSDCTTLDANQAWSHRGDAGTMVNNRLEVETDAAGTYELELCPLPSGPYRMEIFPLLEMGVMDMDPMSMKQNDDQSGFFSEFKVSSADISVVSTLLHVVGDTVTMNVTALDGNQNPIAGQIIAADVIIEDFYLGKKLILWEMATDSTENLTNGTAQLSFTIPSEAPYELNTSVNYSVTTGAGNVYLLIQDTNGEKYAFDNMVFAVKRSAQSSITVPSSVKTNRLLDVNVVTDNASRYKVQAGVFFIQDNSEKMKDWFIEGGLFLMDNQDGTSSSEFKILSPREPGSYYLAMMVYELPLSAMGMSGASEVLLAPVDVTLDLVTVSGRVVELDGSTPIQNALVRLGKTEVYTDASGDFSLQVPKGSYVVEIERKVSSTTKQYMKSLKYVFTEDSALNVSFYRIQAAGSLTQTLFNITSPSTDLSTMKLNINVSLNNTGVRDLDNLTATATAMSGQEIRTTTAAGSGSASVLFRNLYAGFESQWYDLKIKIATSDWNSTGFVRINGTDINTTVGVSMVKTYQVQTYAGEGDGLDNDNDCSSNATMVSDCTPHETWYAGKCIDEEVDNNKDDDCDGRIDEDLEGSEYFEWCGNGFCSAEENAAGSCFEDCAQGYCGDGNCDSGEGTWCLEDCEGDVDICDSPNQCFDDGSPYFCNMWNITEYASWCESTCDADNCWACTQSECEQKGCSLGTDDFANWWCFKEESCGDDSCFACHTSGECAGTSECSWDVDPYSPDGGWCNRPWTCGSECNACMDQSSCENSGATMDNVSCIWNQDQQGGGWCQWNMTWGPPMGIENVWLGSSTHVQDWQSTVDFECWSPNCGSTIDEGSYYILTRISGFEVNVTVNGTLVGVIDNSGNFTQDLLAGAYNFTNGTWIIEVTEIGGPEYLMWTLVIGEQGQGQQPPVCGNSQVESGEQCDDGNTASGDGCSSVCQYEPQGGSGDLSFRLEKTCINCPVQLGMAAQFSLYVENNGTMNVTNYLLVDSYNTSQLNYSWSDVSPDSLDRAEGEVTWMFNLNYGANITRIINLTSLVAGNSMNTLVINNGSSSLFFQQMQFFVVEGGAPIDDDSDSYNSSVDCNDNNASIHPGATEVCNGADDNCNGQIDEGCGGGVLSAWVNKTCLNCPVELGTDALVELTVVNNGTVNLTNYIFNDAYNATHLNLSWTNVPGVEWAGEISWPLNLTVGETATRLLNFTTLISGSSTNWLVVYNESSAVFDYTSALIVVNPVSSPAVSLYVNKTCMNCPILYNGTAVFELTVVNNGSLNITEYALLDNYNSTYLNYSGATASPDMVNLELGTVMWSFDVASANSWTVLLNLSAVAPGVTNNTVMVDNGSEFIAWDFATVVLGGP